MAECHSVNGRLIISHVFSTNVLNVSCLIDQQVVTVFVFSCWSVLLLLFFILCYASSKSPKVVSIDVSLHHACFFTSRCFDHSFTLSFTSSLTLYVWVVTLICLFYSIWHLLNVDGTFGHFDLVYHYIVQFYLYHRRRYRFFFLLITICMISFSVLVIMSWSVTFYVHLTKIVSFCINQSLISQTSFVREILLL